MRYSPEILEAVMDRMNREPGYAALVMNDGINPRDFDAKRYYHEREVRRLITGQKITNQAEEAYRDRQNASSARQKFSLPNTRDSWAYAVKMGCTGALTMDQARDAFNELKQQGWFYDPNYTFEDWAKHNGWELD